MTLTEPQIQSILDDLVDRYQGSVAMGSPLNFYDRVMKRRDTFHNKLPTTFQGRLANMTPFESDSPRQRWKELRSRMIENHFIVRVKEIKETASQRTDANDVEAAFNAALSLVEERNGYMIQAALADAQIIDGVGVLHWRKAEDLYPEYPEAQQIVDLPEDQSDRSRYSTRRKGGVYTETPASVKERRKWDCVKAGFPWIIETPDILSIMWAEDDFGLAIVAYMREMPLLRYVRERDPEALSPIEAEADGEHIYRERPVLGDTTQVQPADRVAVCTLWTRTHWYELTQTSVNGRIMRGQPWKIVVDAQEHHHSRIPFVLVPASRIINRPPEDSYMPALEGMFRLKGNVDRSISLMLGLQEQSAIGMYYLAKIGTGEPLMSAAGTKITLTADAADAYKVPDGYKLEELRADVSPGFVTSVGFLRQEYLDSAPKTGRAEIGSSSSPWTVRFALEQENAEPREYVNEVLRAVRAMVRDIAHCISQETEPTYIFARVTNGSVDEKKVLAIEPKKIGSLDIDVEIDPISQAEKMSLIEQGGALKERGDIDDIEFLSNYLKVQNPDQFYARREAFFHFKNEVQPVLLKQDTAKLLANMIVLGPNGIFVGPGGVEVPPEQVVAQNGGQPIPPPPPPVAMGGDFGGQNPPPPQLMGGVQGGGALAPTLPDLPPLIPPNSGPMRGLPG